MSPLWIQVGLVLLLVLLNAAFAGSEIALISLREGQLSRLESRGGSGRVLARLARDPNRFLATIQIGITLAGFLASASAAVTLAEPLVEPLSFLGGAARATAITLVTIVVSFLTLVFGELAPKRLAMQRAEGWGLAVARPLRLLADLARPVVWLLSHTSDLVVRVLGGDPERQREEVSEEELQDMVATQSTMTADERVIVAGAFEFADRKLRQLVIPRPEVLALPEDIPAPDAMQRLAEGRHSRAPVYRDDFDNVVGTIHLRALVGAEGAVEHHMQKPLILPETVGALSALRLMQSERQQLAVVVNEHGAVEGVVTVEDLVEELVGDIWDEDDPDIQGVQHHADGSLTMPGRFPVHDLPDVGVHLPEGEYTTIAGIVLDVLGRLPDWGEDLDVGDWRITVLERTDRAITKVLLTPRGRRSRTDDPDNRRAAGDAPTDDDRRADDAAADEAPGGPTSTS